MRFAHALLLSLLIGATGTADSVRLAAEAVADGSVSFTIASARDASFRVVLYHDDPLVGPVLDRLLRLNASADTEATIELSGLRPGVNVTIRVLDAAAPLPTLSADSTVPDLSAILGLPSLAVAENAFRPRQTTDALSVQAFHVTGDRNDHGPGFVCARADGVLVAGIAGWNGMEGEGKEEWLRIAVSKDGGHTFGQATTVTTRLGGADVYAWRGACDPVGPLALMIQEREVVTPLGFRLLWFDPSTGTVERETPVPESVRYGRIFDLARTDDGGLVAAFAAPTGPGSPSRAAVEIYRIDGAGTFERIAVVPLTSAEGVTGVRTAANGAFVAVTWQEEARFRFVRSGDGGRTFAPAEDVPMPNVDATRFILEDAAIDPVGSVLVLLRADHHAGYKDGGALYWSQVTLTSLAIAGDIIHHTLSGPGGLVVKSNDASTPMLAASGLRVWAFWDDFINGDLNDPVPAQSFVVESIDGGRTLKPASRLSTSAGAPWWDFQDVTVAHDGRPFLLARQPALQGSPFAILSLFDPFIVDELSTRITVRPVDVVEEDPVVPEDPAAGDAAGAGDTPATGAEGEPGILPEGANDTGGAADRILVGDRVEPSPAWKSENDVAESGRLVVPAASAAFWIFALAILALSRRRRVGNR